MKFIFYKDQKKITLQNVFVPEIYSLENLLDFSQNDLTDLENLQLQKFRITSTRGMFLDDEEILDDEIEEEVFEGINWRQETIN